MWSATESIGAADLRRWLEILDNGERAQAGRFWVELDRREYIAAHALLRSMLTYYADQPPEAWRFATDEYGKPNFAPRSGNPELQFNLAHTRGLVAAAITLRGDIGVDVEKITAEVRSSRCAGVLRAGGAETAGRSFRSGLAYMVLSLVDAQGSLHKGDRHGSKHLASIICLRVRSNPDHLCGGFRRPCGPLAFHDPADHRAAHSLSGGAPTEWRRRSGDFRAPLLRSVSSRGSEGPRQGLNEQHEAWSVLGA